MSTNTPWLTAALVALLLPAAWACSREKAQEDSKGLVLVEESAAAGATAAGEAAPMATEPVSPAPVSAPPAGATPLEAGRQYAAGTRVEAGADGVSFVVPDEWLGGLPPGSAAVVLGSNTRPGIGLVVMRAATTWQEIEQFLNQPQDLGDGVVLNPSSAGRRTGRGYEIDFGNTMYAGHAIGRMGPQGNGLVVFFGGPGGERSYYTQLASRTAASVAFAAPRSGAMQPWRDYLAGMMLRRQSSYYSGSPDGSYVGGSSSETLHLCRDGSYAYFSRSSAAADAGAGTSGFSGSDGGESGQWSVEAIGDRVLLSLRPRSGEVSQHALQVQDDATFVDGERAYRVPSDRCR